MVEHVWFYMIPLKSHRWILWVPYCVMLWIMPLKNYKRTYSNSVVLFIQQNVFFLAGFVAVSGCSSRPLSANEFWEMLSEIRSPAVCRREMLSPTAAFTKTNPAPWSSVCLPVTTIRENETSSGSDYTPSHRTCHLSPFSTDTRVKEEEEEEKEKKRGAWKSVCTALLKLHCEIHFCRVPAG